jgi:hypothetical protein
MTQGCNDRRRTSREAAWYLAASRVRGTPRLLMRMRSAMSRLQRNRQTTQLTHHQCALRMAREHAPGCAAAHTQPLLQQMRQPESSGITPRCAAHVLSVPVCAAAHGMVKAQRYSRYRPSPHQDLLHDRRLAVDAQAADDAQQHHTQVLHRSPIAPQLGTASRRSPEGFEESFQDQRCHAT